jgi:hypothetical protein
MQLKDIIICRDATDSAAGADGHLSLNLTLPPTLGTLGLRKFDPSKTQAPPQTPPTQRAFEAQLSQSSVRSLHSLPHSLPSASAFARGKRRAGMDQTEDSRVCISPAAEGGAMTAMMTPSGLMMTKERNPPGSPLCLPSPRERSIEKKERHASQLRMETKALQEEIRAPDASGATGRPLHTPAATGRPLRRMSIKEYDAFIGQYSSDIDAGAARSQSDGKKGCVAGRSQPEAQHDCKWTGVKPPCVDYIDAFKRKPGFPPPRFQCHITAASLRLPRILPLRTHDGGYQMAIKYIHRDRSLCMCVHNFVLVQHQHSCLLVLATTRQHQPSLQHCVQGQRKSLVGLRV